MVVYCFVCKNNSKAKPALGYFKFPKEENRCALWFQAINRPRLPKHTSQFCSTSLRLCSEHFEQKDVNLNAQRKRLDLDALPIYNLDASVNQEFTESLETTGQCKEDNQMFRAVSPEPSSSQTLLCKTTSPFAHSESKMGSPQPSTSKNLGFNRDACTETPHTLSANTPRKAGLKRKIRFLTQKVRRRGSSGSEDSFPPLLTATNVGDFLYKNYNPQFANFVRIQMDLLNKSPRGARYSDEYKQFALTIYFLGPSCYRHLASSFRLPSKSTLMSLTKKWPINPGLNDFVFSVLKNQVENMDDSSRDCVLCLDEMSLHTNFHYNIGQDEVIGFHQTINRKTFEPGNNALTLMVRGINSNWKQPLAYFFVNSACPAEDLQTILFEAIKKLYSINLRVRMVVSDQGSNFFKLVQSLGITVETPYFFVETFKIYFMFDVPHLLKSTRNNFFKYCFSVNNLKTSKEYLDICYNIDKTQSYRLVPKLSDAHINPTNFQKMKVKYAAQIFSATVAAALNSCLSHGDIKSDAMFTIEFIDKMDKLFDIFNSSRFNPSKSFNRPFMGAEEQINFLNEMADLFKNLKVLNNNCKEIRVKFVFGWRLAISSFLNFWRDFKSSGVNYILTRRLNQDCLENFFGKIRQQNGNCRNPTPIQFLRTFKKMFALTYFQQSEGTNCVEDFAEVLTHLTPERIDSFKVVIKPITQFDKIIISTTDYRQLNFTGKNAFFYVGGYFIKKCLEKHSCEICTNYARATQELSENTIYTHFRAYQNAANDIFGNLKSPHNSFFDFFGLCENLFAGHFKDLAILPNVGIKLREKILALPFSHPCGSFPQEYFASLFVRTRIFYTLKFLNRDILKAKPKSRTMLNKLRILQHL